MTDVLHLAASEPAGGAELAQVAIATAGASLATTALFVLGYLHRAGRSSVLSDAAALAGRVSGLPGWAALPSGVAGGALLVALLGMYWDIALHIDAGRDAGPLANPAHYLILAGLFGIFAAGVLALVLPRDGERPGPAAVRLMAGWHVPVGGLLIVAASAFALVGFPLDDVWHRLFGQDVTLWGPTHLMLIGGAGLTLVGQAVLLAEGMRATPRSAAAAAGAQRPGRDLRLDLPSMVTLLRRVALMGGFLIGLSTFQAEYDFGVPQFRLVLHPFLVALAAGFALVAARVWAGPGAALGAAIFFIVVRGAVAVLVGPVLGQTTPMMPLFLVEALLIEAAARKLERRPFALAAVGGALVGTIGFAAEYAWTQVAFRIPWTPDILGEGLVLALVGGLAGGFLGALLASGLRGELPRPGVARPVTALAVLAIGVCVAVGLQMREQPGAAVAVTLDDRGIATVRTDVVRGDAAWMTVTAWQGDGLVVDRLEVVGPGVWRGTRPVPVDGEWKSFVRIQDGRVLVSAPIRMPADAAIPAPEVQAEASFTRPLVADARNLQRERDFDVPSWLWTAACLLVLLIALGLTWALAWGVARFSRRSQGVRRPPAEPQGPAGGDRVEPRDRAVDAVLAGA